MKKGIRTCISCRGLDEQNSMIKITRTQNGLIVSPSRYSFGRSAYICYSESCIKAAKKFGKLERSLKTTCVDEEFWDDIKTELDNRTLLIKKCG